MLHRKSHYEKARKKIKCIKFIKQKGKLCLFADGFVQVENCEKSTKLLNSECDKVTGCKNINKTQIYFIY